jgi:hypothetical protein
MPLVSFRPTKARLVIEEGKDSVLVMKVAVAKGESVELSTGGRLEALSGVLRIRERKTNFIRPNGHAIGSLIYIDGTPGSASYGPPKFQINLGMAAEKFDPLLRVALSGRLPNKFFVDAGEKMSSRQTRGITYRLKRDARTKLDVRTKVWDTTSFRTLPVTNFAMILPIDVPDAPDNNDDLVPELHNDAHPLESMATNAQVAELVDDLLVFQSETRNTLYALIAVVSVVVVLALVFGLVILLR